MSVSKSWAALCVAIYHTQAQTYNSQHVANHLTAPLNEHTILLITVGSPRNDSSMETLFCIKSNKLPYLSYFQVEVLFVVAGAHTYFAQRPPLICQRKTNLDQKAK